MKLPPTCSGYSLSKIDWISLSRSVPILNRKTKREIHFHLAKFFNPQVFESTVSPNQIKMRNDNFQIKITAMFISLEVQGYFWTLNEDAFEQFKTLHLSLNNFLKEYFQDEINWHFTRIDICQDFENVLPAFFRIPIANHRMFKAKLCNFNDLPRGKDIIDTGFKVYSSQWELGCYRKDIEAEYIKNARKKLYVLNKLKSGIPLTRLELRLFSARLCEYASWLFSCHEGTETEFATKVLNEFYGHHRILIENEKDSNKSRWHEDADWKSFFVLDENTAQIKFKAEVGINKGSISFFSSKLKPAEIKLINQISDLNYKLKSLGFNGIDSKIAEADQLASKRAEKKRKEALESLKFNQMLSSKGEIAS